MQCGLLRLNRLLRERPKPEGRAFPEPGAPARGRRERCGTHARADRGPQAQKAERETGWIVSVDNFS
ncbi:MAG TPA: hypothetical protein VF601_22100 [Beijerinckiaceae bacterium]